jgi:hypothetical protein
MALNLGGLSTLTGLRALVFVTAATLAFASFNGSLFSWHPFTLSLGYIYFMAEGLLVAWQLRQIDGLERVQAIELHATHQIRALLLIVVGAGAIIYNKVGNPPSREQQVGL